MAGVFTLIATLLTLAVVPGEMGSIRLDGSYKGTAQFLREVEFSFPVPDTIDLHYVSLYLPPSLTPAFSSFGSHEQPCTLSSGKARCKFPSEKFNRVAIIDGSEDETEVHVPFRVYLHYEGKTQGTSTLEIELSGQEHGGGFVSTSVSQEINVDENGVEGRQLVSARFNKYHQLGGTGKAYQEFVDEIFEEFSRVTEVPTSRFFPTYVSHRGSAEMQFLIFPPQDRSQSVNASAYAHWDWTARQVAKQIQLEATYPSSLLRFNSGKRSVFLEAGSIRLVCDTNADKVVFSDSCDPPPPESSSAISPAFIIAVIFGAVAGLIFVLGLVWYKVKMAKVEEQDSDDEEEH